MARSLMDPEKLVVKRIIGMPGDRVTPRADSTAYPAGTTAVTIPWNHVWVEGDSDSGRLSLDSNSYGPISMNLISGLVVRVLLPRMRALRCQDWEAGEEGKQQRMRVEKNAVAVYEPPS
jgi:inner membrane protease subunit 2